MKRSQFCKKLITPGLACGCAITISGKNIFDSVISQDQPGNNQNETPCNEKMEFTQKWVKRFFEIMDQQIDEKTRINLMQANGAECARGAYGEITDRKPATLEEIDKTIADWQEKMGKNNIYRNGNTVYFGYESNPKGLKTADGYCLCPMLENGPATLSSTFCQCSLGYVKYMFRKFITYSEVNAELLESVRTGGKACRFRIMI
jgi:hypothetical protein